VSLIKNCLIKCKEKKAYVIAASAVLCVVVGIFVAVIVMQSSKDEITYKEALAETGILSVGVTETGSVDVGTTLQSFDLDISQFAGETGYSWASSGMGGMDMMAGMMSGSQSNGSATSSSDTRNLEVEEVYVKAGQEVHEGDPILKLTAESVDSIRTELTEDETSALLSYEQALTVNKQTQVSADSDYKTNTLYSAYARSEYEQTVKKLQETVEEKQELLEETQESLLEAQNKLADKEALLTEEKQVLENALFIVNGIEREGNLYWWIDAWQTKEDTETMVEALKEEIEELSESIEDYKEQIESEELEVTLAQKELELGALEAEAQLELRTFKAENAQEIYDVAIEQGDFDMESAKAAYEDAQEKLSEFDGKIVEQVIYSSGNGLITDVHVEAGDVLTQNASLISLNDYDAVTITLSVDEEDMEAAAVGSPVNVTIAAFPEQIFEGQVTEIGDAEINSNTNKTVYTVIVTVQNTGELFYQDMTAEVTFLTDETEEVLYIPNRAITTEDGKSFVMVRDGNGTIETREVTTGFTDGINTEIKEGLSEGEIVLWEVGVRKS